MENNGPRHRKQSVAQLERDAALHRVTRTRRFVIGGAAALSAGIAAFVSAIAPGHSLGANKALASGGDTSSGTATSGASTARASVSSKKMPPLAKPSDLGLTGPPSGPTSPVHANHASSASSSSAASGNTGVSGNSGNTGSAGSAGNTGVSGNSGNTGNSASAPAGNSGPVAATPAPAPTSGGS
jgi:hypothetical protein